MIINLFAGPGCGKSTLALGLGHFLKKQGHEAAVIIEEAKPHALRGDPIGAAEQLEIMYHQYRAESAYYDLADYVITDSPLELQAYYYYLRTGGFAYGDLVSGLRKQGPERRNFFLTRLKGYEQRGRYQTEDEAKKADIEIKKFLWMHLCLDITDTTTHDPEEFIERYVL